MNEWPHIPDCRIPGELGFGGTIALGPFQRE